MHLARCYSFVKRAASDGHARISVLNSGQFIVIGEVSIGGAIVSAPSLLCERRCINLLFSLPT
jgi:hypothetical protein